MENDNKGVRVKRGVWTKEEDVLLRSCIQKYGEGKWRNVPLRAGLSRSKKSCRLRWMNYLRPDIRRGYFTKDEADLIVRLHKLLGNRWSLISGRLPGRTANDVKNFWNTQIAKKSPPTIKSYRPKTITKCNIIKPRPRNLTISKLQPPSCPSDQSSKTNEPNNVLERRISDENQENEQPPSSSLEEPNHSIDRDENSTNDKSSSHEEVDESSIQWWRKFLQVSEDDEALHGFANNYDRLSSLSMDDVLELLILIQIMKSVLNRLRPPNQ